GGDGRERRGVRARTGGAGRNQHDAHPGHLLAPGWARRQDALSGLHAAHVGSSGRGSEAPRAWRGARFRRERSAPISGESGLTPRTAMVLAAGLGMRMRPLTNDRPKALVTVGGRALIDHVLDRLIGAGVARAVVNVHAFADMLEAHVRRRHDIEIVIS